VSAAYWTREEREAVTHSHEYFADGKGTHTPNCPACAIEKAKTTVDALEKAYRDAVAHAREDHGCQHDVDRSLLAALEDK
jgi:hypothetical protein